MKSKELTYRLMSWGTIQITIDEMFILVRHWRMMMLYMASFLVMYQLRYRQDQPDVSLWVKVLLHFLAQFSALPLVLFVVWIISKFAPRRGPTQIFVTPIIVCSIALSVVMTEVIVGLFGGSYDLSPMRLIGWTLLAAVVAEFFGAIAAHLILPVVLAEIRGTQDQPVEMTILPDTSQENPASHIMEPKFLIVGTHRFPVAALLHARAEGNYVDLTFTTGRHYALATLMSVTDQLREIDGCLLSRSFWVSAKAISDYRRDGKNYIVTTVDDREFRVARSRNDSVLPWLQQRFATLEKR